MKHLLIIFLILTSHFTYAVEEENIYLICEGYNWDYEDKKTKDTRTYHLKLGQNYSIISYGSSKEIVCDLSNNLVECKKYNYDYGGKTVNVAENIIIEIDRIDGLIEHIENYVVFDGSEDKARAGWIYKNLNFVFEGTCEKRKKKKF